jgi:NAD(P)-dependent dehydrogenase (short-subunit alcohol dehydrogenase family)
MTPDDALLTGRTAIVTGAGAGIGKGVAIVLARFGARVVVAELVPDTGERTADEIRRAGGDALAIPTDVREPEQVARAVAAAIERYGSVDVLVNNAGGTFTASFLDSAEKGWDALHRANLKSVLHCTQAAARRMVEQGRGGSIVNVVSIEAVRAAPGYAPYAAAKAGVEFLRRSVAPSWLPHRIRVNAVAPDIRTIRLRALVSDADRARSDWTVPSAARASPMTSPAPSPSASELGRHVTGITPTSTAARTRPAAGTAIRPTARGHWVLRGRADRFDAGLTAVLAADQLARTGRSPCGCYRPRWSLGSCSPDAVIAASIGAPPRTWSIGRSRPSRPAGRSSSTGRSRPALRPCLRGTRRRRALPGVRARRRSRVDRRTDAAPKTVQIAQRVIGRRRAPVRDVRPDRKKIDSDAQSDLTYNDGTQLQDRPTASAAPCTRAFVKEAAGSLAALAQATRENFMRPRAACAPRRQDQG